MKTFLRPPGKTLTGFLHKAPSLVPAPVFREGMCRAWSPGSRGCLFAGFQGLLGANELHVCAAAVTRSVTGGHVVVGDICSDEVLRGLWHAFPHEAGLAAGFFAVNHWLVVDMRTWQARSLSGVLRAAFLLQAPWMVLECISSSATNELVRHLLEGFLPGSAFQHG